MSESADEATKAGGGAKRALSRILAVIIWVAGALGLVGGGGWIHAFYTEEAAKAAALIEGPPAMITLEELRTTPLGPFDEVLVTAQMTPSSLVANPTPNTRWIVPLYGANAVAPERPIAWMAHAVLPWGQGELQVGGRAVGPFGPLVEVNGRLVDPKQHYGAVVQALGRFDEMAVVIEPFAMPRQRFLAPAEPDWLSWGVYMAAIAGILLYGVMLWRKE